MMDDSGFGIYSLYFKVLRLFGVFPYRIENMNHVAVHRNGPFTWLFYLNYILVVFGATFQAVQLLLTIMYGQNPVNVISQLCWMFAMCIPLSSMRSYITKEERVAHSVDTWCQLERTVLGSSLRGLPSMPNGHLPSMSACHAAQNRLFKKTVVTYTAMGITGVIGLLLHFYFLPRFPGYIYALTAEDDPLIMLLCGIYQLWIAIIIWMNIFGCEVIMIIASGSLIHCLETLSYRGAVVLTNLQCDVPHLNEVIIKNWAAFEGKSNQKSGFNGAGNRPPSSIMTQSQEKVISALEPRMKESGGGKPGLDDNSVYLASVVQNVVDIQYALDRYKDVEAVVDSLNNAFGKMLFSHQTVYMILMCTLFYTPVRHLRTLPIEGSGLFALIAFYYCYRLFQFFPAMGRVNYISKIFVESWMEGLRHIPRGKYAYEFYMHKLESCRKLAFNCGGFYIMQKGTVLTFVSIVTTNVIVLLQLY